MMIASLGDCAPCLPSPAGRAVRRGRLRHQAVRGECRQRWAHHNGIRGLVDRPGMPPRCPARPTPAVAHSPNSAATPVTIHPHLSRTDDRPGLTAAPNITIKHFARAGLQRPVSRHRI